MTRMATSLLATLAIVLSAVAQPAAAQSRQTMQAVEGEPAAPAFTLHDLNDQRRSLADYRGRVVAVNFWATWCPPCRMELPSMQRAYRDLKDKGLVILGVNEGEDWDTVAPFLESYSIQYPILFDKDSTVIQQWKVLGLPTTFIVDRKGRIAYRINGGRNWDDAAFRKALEAVLEAD